MRSDMARVLGFETRSGAVGPILSQSLGAWQFGWVRECMRASLWFMLLAVDTAWLLLALPQGPLIRAFSLVGMATAMVHAFCSGVCASFFFAAPLVLWPTPPSTAWAARCGPPASTGPAPPWARFPSLGGARITHRSR